MADRYSTRRLEQRTIADADQAEFTAILRGSTVVDAGIFDDRIAGALDDFEPDDVTVEADWHRRDLEYDSAVGHVHEEVHRRSVLMGQCYPFRVEQNQVIYTRSNSGFYEFCLAICNAQTITTGEMVGLPRTFERVVALLVKAYLGVHSEALHVGAPRDPEVGSRFRDGMRRLHEHSGEWFWGPSPDLPQEPTSVQDEGVDFVAWKRATDRRPGSLFVLGQCACGDDWDGKLHDLDLSRLGKWFNPMSYVQPVRAFATPRHLSDGHLFEAQRQAGMVFDRARLTIIAEEVADAGDYTAWMPRLSELSRLVIEPPPALS